jgi:hypothetical protein
MQVELRTLDGKRMGLDKRSEVLGPTRPIPCFHCGECCVNQRPILLREDVISLAQGLRLSLLTFLRQFVEKHPTRPGRYLFRSRLGDCPFLERRGVEAMCSVHAFKPAACDAWTPSLWRDECRDGLAKRLGPEGLSLPHQIYTDDGELARFLEALQAERSIDT